MRKNPVPELVLSREEHAHLQALTQRRTASQALALRARIVLACARGLARGAIARWEHVTLQTVAKWHARFAERRLDGLQDSPRSGAPRTVDDARVRAVLAKTLHAVAPDGACWSTRSMARECGVSQSAVSRIWRAHGLQPRLRAPNQPALRPVPRGSAGKPR